MKTAYLSDSQIDQMAEAALSGYEWACCWRRAAEVAREAAADDFGVRATSSQIGLAVRLAQTKWQGYVMGVKRQIGGAA